MEEPRRSPDLRDSLRRRLRLRLCWYCYVIVGGVKGWSSNETASVGNESVRTGSAIDPLEFPFVRSPRGFLIGNGRGLTVADAPAPLALLERNRHV